MITTTFILLCVVLLIAAGGTLEANKSQEYRLKSVSMAISSMFAICFLLFLIN